MIAGECVECGLCVASCPVKALSIEQEAKPPETTKEVKKRG
ncbi:MAG: 4Fe-4S dicluster domain-containing protein [Desulfofundulus sp.]